MDYNKAAEFGLQTLLIKRLTTPGELPAPTVAPEMFPCIVLENDRPEWGVLKGERLAGAAGTVTGVAAVNSVFGLFNPAGSNMIATLDELGLFAAGSTVQILLTKQALALAPVVATVRDARWVQPGSATARPVCTVQEGTQAVVFSEPVIGRVAGGVYVPYSVPIVIPPGWGLVAFVTQVNVSLTSWCAAWRERGAQPGELA